VIYIAQSIVDKNKRKNK